MLGTSTLQDATELMRWRQASLVLAWQCSASEKPPRGVRRVELARGAYALEVFAWYSRISFRCPLRMSSWEAHLAIPSAAQDLSKASPDDLEVEEGFLECAE
jgi:hypothetical protein